MPAYERHVFICSNDRPVGHMRGCCAEKGGAAVRAAFKDAVKAHGLKGEVRANPCGCLDQCEHGVTVVVYPEAVWYGFVTVEDVPEIVEQHLVGGKPVERLRLAPGCINTPSCQHRGAPVL